MTKKFWHKAPTAAIRVSFVAGPYDGHSQRTDEEHLRSEVALPISRNVLAMLSGGKPSPTDVVSGLAWYSLQRDGDKVRYVYRGRMTMAEFMGRECAGK